jgi:hypothetical protein
MAKIRRGSALASAAGAAATANWARAEHFVHDPPDGTSATAALGAAAKTTIDLANRAWPRVHSGHDGAHLMVTEHVAGADDHGSLCLRRGRSMAGLPIGKAAAESKIKVDIYNASKEGRQSRANLSPFVPSAMIRSYSSGHPLYLL